MAEQHLHLGRVFGSIGAETPNYVSFRGKQSALIRGNEKSTHRHCEECNAVLYHPMGDRYLLARPEGFGDLMESQLNQLIVSEPLLERVRASGRFEFAVDELPILDEPRDGLSKDPAEWPPPPMTESRERYERIMASHRRAKARLDAEKGS